MKVIENLKQKVLKWEMKSVSLSNFYEKFNIFVKWLKFPCLLALSICLIEFN